eukprot:COSAG02_NODE_1176_length_14061_cov_96.089529_14_plen_124_part_00
MAQSSGIAAHGSSVAFQKHQTLRDEKAKLESELAADAASAEHKALNVDVSELQSKNDELEQRLEALRAERAKYQMLTEEQDLEADRLARALQEYTEYRDGIHRDLTAMKQLLQKADIMQVGAC